MSNENEQLEQRGAEKPATWKRVWIVTWLTVYFAQGRLPVWFIVYVLVILGMAEIGWRQHFFWERSDHGPGPYTFPGSGSLPQ